MTRVKLLLGGVALATLAIAASASAQDAPNTSQNATPQPAVDTPPGDIIVTAQKREQRLIDVPLAITAVSAQALTTQSLNRLSDFYDRVPGLQYSGQRVSSLSLRGITTGGATSPTVALLVDDVQFGGTTGAGQPPLPDFDPSALDRVEVLRGPQGTLYGASSLGGLIKYVLKQPDTTHFSGHVEAGGTTVAQGGTGYALRGSVNVPLSDWLAVTASGFKRSDAPYLDNARTGRTDTNTRKVWGYRGAVLLKPTQDLSLSFSALHQRQDAINSDLAITSGGVPVCIACTTGGTQATRDVAPTTFEPVYGDLTINSLDSTNLSKYTLYSGRAEYNFGSVKLTSISAWSKADNIITSDVTAVFGGFLLPDYSLTASSGSSVTIGNADKTTKFSQEVRLGGSAGQFDWLVGGFYTVEHANTLQTLFVYNPSGALTAVPYVGQGPSRYRETAGYADVTWHATDKLDIQIGGRYASNSQNFVTSTAIDAKAVQFGSSNSQVKASSDKAFLFLVSPTYHFSHDIMVYGRIATGYRPGGPNLDSTGVGNFGPDRVTSYELGFKGRVVPGLLTIDAALFQVNWKNIQLQATATNQFTFIVNGGTARSRGLEFAANLTPWHGMSIDANLALSDATLTQNLPPVNSTSLVGSYGDRLPYTANVTASVTAQQTFDLSDSLRGTFSANYTYVGDRPSGFNVGNGTRPRIMIPSYDTINFTAGLTFDRKYSLSLFMRNAGNERGVSTAQNRNGTNVPTALFIQPRTVGATLGVTF